MIYWDNTLSLRYVSAGRFVTQDPWIHPQRRLDTYEILLGITGQAHIQEEKRRYLLGPGDLLVLHPWRTHFGYEESREAVSFYWAHFAAEPYDALGLERDFFAVNDTDRMLLLFRQLLHTANGPMYSAVAAELSLGLLLCEAATQQRVANQPELPLLLEIREWIRINSHRPLTARETAAQFQYNSDYLSRLFQASFHVGLKEYISQERLRAIKSLLLSTDYTVGQIAGLTGFQDTQALLKYFRYHQGQSPTQYRRVYRYTHLNNR